jgi:adenylate cyclase
LNKNWKEKGVGEVKARIGLHIGNAIVWNIGATGRKIEYTALWDSVNLASRLEWVNKFYGTYICVSEDIYKETKADFEFRYLDTIRVKWKDKAVKIYEVLSHKWKLDKTRKALISRFLKARTLYGEKSFKEALVLFKELSDLWDKPSWVYLKRCEDFLEKKPNRTWNSIWDFEEK